MNNVVRLEEKKQLIRWFLNTYECKKRDAACLLNYILHHDALLSRVHFSLRADNLPTAITITATCSQEASFSFKKMNQVYTQVSRAFDHIRLNQDEQVYLILHFHNREQSPEYAVVLEGNHMNERFAAQENLMGLFAEIALDEALRSYRESKIYLEIDQALSMRDESRFLRLTEELNHLKKMSH